MQVTSVSNRILDHDILDTLNSDHETNCPLTLTKGKRLLEKTISNHIKQHFLHLIQGKTFYFCEVQNCPVAYFNNQNQLFFGLDDLRTVIMHKMPINTPDRPACYCKNILEQDILDELLVKKCCDSLTDIQHFTKANTGKECSVTNPSGRCCVNKIIEILEWASLQRHEVDSLVLEEAMACCENIETVIGQEFK
jgi:hypothetical protein